MVPWRSAEPWRRPGIVATPRPPLAWFPPTSYHFYFGFFFFFSGRLLCFVPAQSKRKWLDRWSVSAISCWGFVFFLFFCFFFHLRTSLLMARAPLLHQPISLLLRYILRQCCCCWWRFKDAAVPRRPRRLGSYRFPIMRHRKSSFNAAAHLSASRLLEDDIISFILVVVVLVRCFSVQRRQEDATTWSEKKRV